MEDHHFSVTVKPLEWHHSWEFGLDLWRAERYEISQHLGVGPYHVRGNGMISQSKDKLDDAKELAQRHHESRVLGWIEIVELPSEQRSSKRESLLNGIQNLINIADQAEAEDKNDA
jgi:hypothetical protein